MPGSDVEKILDGPLHKRWKKGKNSIGFLTSGALKATR